MNSKLFSLIYALLFAYMLSGCGMHYTINGQVVDAKTKKPVQGAVVAINWVRYKLLSPPGLGPERVEYGSYDSVTDDLGNFTITKYLVGEYHMGIYKPGYVCWNNETVFNPDGKTYEEIYLRRKNLSLHDGVIVELEPIKKSEFPVVKHARFVSDVERRLDSLKFAKATLKERKLKRKDYRKRWGFDK